MTHGVVAPTPSGLGEYSDVCPHDGPTTLVVLSPAFPAGTWKNQGQASDGRQTTGSLGDAKEQGMVKMRERLLFQFSKTLGRIELLPPPNPTH